MDGHLWPSRDAILRDHRPAAADRHGAGAQGKLRAAEHGTARGIWPGPAARHRCRSGRATGGSSAVDRGMARAFCRRGDGRGDHRRPPAAPAAASSSHAGSASRRREARAFTGGRSHAGRRRQIALIGGGGLALIGVLMAGYLSLSPKSGSDGLRQTSEASIAAEKDTQAEATRKAEAGAGRTQKPRPDREPTPKPRQRLMPGRRQMPPRSSRSS